MEGDEGLMKFGENLKRIRKQRRISQEDLAEEVGVSRQSVSKWETGDAYPEMNNILQICKIFHVSINDLVHEDMSDINSLGDDVKMKVVKFKEEKQKKMKGLSKAIYIISKIFKIVPSLAIVVSVISMFLLPFSLKSIEVTGSNLMINNTLVGTIENKVELTSIKNLFETSTLSQIIIYSEIILLSLIICMIVLFIILNALEKLFKNIHNGETPFTLENISYIKKIAKYLIIEIAFPIVMGFVMQLIMQTNLGIEIELVDIIFVLIIYSISYIFEYGYELQKDSKGVMYETKK